MRIIICFLGCLFAIIEGYGQTSQKYSAVNPALIIYQTEDVYINPPLKFQGGKNIISPDPETYP